MEALKAFKVIWDAVNGKKTNIGAIITAAVVLLQIVGMVDEANSLQQIYDILSKPEVIAELTGVLGIIIGLIHKWIKKYQK